MTVIGRMRPRRPGRVPLSGALLAGALVVGCASGGGRSAASAATPPGGSEKVYVVNQSGASIAVIDQYRLAVDTVLDLRALGFSANAKPHHVAVEQDGSHWYVSLIGDGRVLKFDRTNRLVAQVQMETPGLLTLDPVHDSLYVGRSMTAVNPPRSLGVIARRNFTLVDEQEIVISRPHALAVTPDGRWVHTASLAENRIASVEVATGRVVLSTIPGAPRSLVQFALSPDGQRMAVGGELSNTVLLFDLTRPPPLQPIAEHALDGKPWEPRFASDGRTLYVTLLSRNALAEMDVATGIIRRVIDGRMAQPYSMLIRADGRYAFVVSQNTGALKAGQSGHEMHGMEGHAPTDGWLSIIDLRSGAVASTLMLGSGPTGLGAAGAR
jgi:DNA-binding beta-propeller fold protein YncE